MKSKENSANGSTELSNELISPKSMNKAQQNRIAKDLAEGLKKSRTEMTSEEKRELTLMQLRLQIEEYLETGTFDKKKTLGYFLKTYIKCLNKKANEFASEIALTPAVLSQYITDARIPPTSIMIRFEIHSHNTITAVHWYRLVEKGKIYQIKEDRKMRREQKKFVTHDAEIS